MYDQIALDENVELKDGDILYKDDKNIVVIKIKGDDVLVIKPKCMTEMGVIAHALGNRLLPLHGMENSEAGTLQKTGHYLAEWK